MVVVVLGGEMITGPGVQGWNIEGIFSIQVEEDAAGDHNLEGRSLLQQRIDKGVNGWKVFDVIKDQEEVFVLQELCK